jgi:hypothetical protein
MREDALFSASNIDGQWLIALLSTDIYASLMGRSYSNLFRTSKFLIPKYNILIFHMFPYGARGSVVG